MAQRVMTGLDRVLAGDGPDLRGARVGLVAHPASVTATLEHAASALARSGVEFGALFGPQHGLRGEKQDNMIESRGFTTTSGVVVHSLYGEVRQPTQDMLRGLDMMLFDLQDVGVRVYTFAWTMTLVMAACRQAGVRFVVLDRPNPITACCEGPVLQPGFASFVGLHPVPLRHGLTLGELARVANEEFGIGCDLDVVACEGWRRDMWFDETGLPFVMPSPNIPTLDTTIVYPGMVLLEGTNLSEGRGTTRPFELFGAPSMDPDALVDQLDSYGLEGVRFRGCYFEPTFQKYAGQLCGGAQIHVTDRATFRPVDTAVAILHAAKALSPGFAWREPPYEYEFEKRPIDILWGTADLRESLDRGAEPDEVLASATEDLGRFQEMVRPHLLY
jgi:uncharacterized protein YbbC (DUF1343 family)